MDTCIYKYVIVNIYFKKKNQTFVLNINTRQNIKYK